MTVAPPSYDTIPIQDGPLKDSDDQGIKKSPRSSTSTSNFLQSFLRNIFISVTLIAAVLGCSVAFFMANTATHQDQVATAATTTSLFRLDSKGGGNGSNGGGITSGYGSGHVYVDGNLRRRRRRRRLSSANDKHLAKATKTQRRVVR
eukprot:CAMPEP_0170819086 /NCGR_PEP_ID=MMETSP0733-20121128/41205_1 /TAXON_ID=186038 /ORGANISM="Fragilariopsis kerguelensis, Strain L26-C5" /LENGTH=146 /DNA_ID=CAMNT_0011179489 /DNA_START=49 /DNA_END=489 /DNA_ORIENTATION=-